MIGPMGRMVEHEGEVVDCNILASDLFEVADLYGFDVAVPCPGTIEVRVTASITTSTWFSLLASAVVHAPDDIRGLE